MDENEPCFDQDPAILQFKETILNSLRQLETKIMNISSTLESTDKQIAAIVTAQKALHIEKGSKLEEAELIQDTQDLRQSDTQIQTFLTQQNKMKSSFQSISSTMTKMFEMLTGTSASSSLGEDDEVADDLLDSTITKIASTNICTLNKNKFISLIDAMKDHNINIYGLSETNCSEQQAKIWQHQLGVRGYFEYSQLGGKGQGVGIIIDAKYDIFVHKAVGHKGRILYLDLYFSDKRKLRLIQVYLNANQKERPQIEALYKYIDDTISDAQSRALVKIDASGYISGTRYV
ncbi:hypothetical protein GLOIN_2v1777011 [Rhizophagus clarus]|uniref:Uncharacterized protein n=1 Tax=Rhizophagus clarus TaxID=94130 RepID=A0A8H3LK50_9GLOM|nr:hypothetical protein GLOIN_2v1777011 [Rhizophagus clarus]